MKMRGVMDSNKKGLSTVVTTVIMVLLVLVAVGVVWVVIRNIIEDASGQISTDQITVDLEILSVQNNSGNTQVDVRVQRGGGSGDLVALAFGISDGTETKVVQKSTTLGELESSTFAITGAELGTAGFAAGSLVVDEVGVAAVVDAGGGNTATGDFIHTFTTTGVSVTVT